MMVNLSFYRYVATILNSYDELLKLYKIKGVFCKCMDDIISPARHDLTAVLQSCDSQLPWLLCTVSFHCH